ncbi:hypothetical protein [Cohnella nanjingensis]|uniref:Uncharacterized protein n=1 Tax=Cohnella nanjingensis TaxID=1387779 RepID=A0A7X0RRM3_9BACL|nr:hypothetical protein [Cohnella nanjingensis]MBB6671251.1 hypothetical protein [Cohnella nanjingensis]
MGCDRSILVGTVLAVGLLEHDIDGIDRMGLLFGWGLLLGLFGTAVPTGAEAGRGLREAEE